MSRINWRQIAIILIFATQIIFAIIVSPLTGIEDLFPLHKWALFHTAVKGRVYPIMYIHQWDDEKFDPPINYHDFFRGKKHIDFLAGRDHLVFWTDKLREHREDAQYEKETFEKHFFGESKVIYSVNEEYLDQVEFRKTRKVIRTEKSHGPFTYPTDDSFSREKNSPAPRGNEVEP